MLIFIKLKAFFIMALRHNEIFYALQTTGQRLFPFKQAHHRQATQKLVAAVCDLGWWAGIGRDRLCFDHPGDRAVRGIPEPARYF